jgi:hypothetical protein
MLGARGAWSSSWGGEGVLVEVEKQNLFETGMNCVPPDVRTYD